MRIVTFLISAALVAGCTTTSSVPSGPSTPTPTATQQPTGPLRSTEAARAMLSQVVDRVEPVAEQECRARTQGVNCNLSIFYDDDPRAPSNAYQTLDKNGNPIIVFNAALAREVQNTDEMAFILGHEAAHHIAGHIPQTQNTIAAGAILGGVLVAAAGGGSELITTAQDIGATVGSRAFSKEFELEADSLGAIIAAKAGYDPVRGVAYFRRAPDPGNQFLGTHPPNADRIRVVEQTMAGR